MDLVRILAEGARVDHQDRAALLRADADVSGLREPRRPGRVCELHTEGFPWPVAVT
ncbi:hypothetical protein Aros01_08266 [Streptosporangium roseum]|uniref:Uncharacterized protein n=1 Tax=Streptosporangium roseum (strain ATCC 12428 / DSM 43021 / JCM 3005 / KCTC 9067 / NCIMB 10171 / NRRL 2505 / NI 9100) TaxID=479432 RepID=D2AX32_STRRD|nr:hypothetical protein Sros_8104 [Streptosporangium roseum DSM 43021]